MSEPKHIWPSSLGRKLASVDDAGEPRYTLTSGPEWDALKERMRARARFVWSDSEEVLRDLLAYFGESDE